MILALAILAVTCSSNAPQDGACASALTVGGKPWVSAWSPYAPPPHWLRLTLAHGTSPREPVGAVSYVMRQDGGVNGTLRTFRLDCDGVQVVAGSTGLANAARQPVRVLADLNGRGCWELTLHFDSTWGGVGPAKWASADEIRVDAPSGTCDPCTAKPPVIGKRPGGRMLRGGWPVELWQQGATAPLAEFDCTMRDGEDGAPYCVCPLNDYGVALQRYVDIPVGRLSVFEVKTKCDEPDCRSDLIPVCGTCIWAVSATDRKGSYQRAKTVCPCGVN